MKVGEVATMVHAYCGAEIRYEVTGVTHQGRPLSVSADCWSCGGGLSYSFGTADAWRRFRTQTTFLGDWPISESRPVVDVELPA